MSDMPLSGLESKSNLKPQMAGSTSSQPNFFAHDPKWNKRTTKIERYVLTVVLIVVNGWLISEMRLKYYMTGNI